MHPSVTTIYGEPGTIKTSIALTWPKPIAAYNLEGGLYRGWVDDDGVNILDKLIASGDVVERVFDLPPRSLVERYEKLSGYGKAWGELTAQMEKDFNEFATILWDTGTVVWALARDCVLEEIQQRDKTRKQLQQIEYGLPNRFMQELFNLPRAFKKNLVMTYHETDEYMGLVGANGTPILDQDTGRQASAITGKKTPDGFKHTLGLSDWVIRTVLEDAEVWEDHVMRVETTPTGIIQKSAYGFHLRGARIAWSTYGKIAELVDPPAVDTESEKPLETTSGS